MQLIIVSRTTQLPHFRLDCWRSLANRRLRSLFGHFLKRSKQFCSPHFLPVLSTVSLSMFRNDSRWFSNDFEVFKRKASNVSHWFWVVLDSCERFHAAPFVSLLDARESVRLSLGDLSVWHWPVSSGELKSPSIPCNFQSVSRRGSLKLAIQIRF